MKKVLVLAVALVLVAVGLAHAELWKKPAAQPGVQKAAVPIADVIAEKKAGLNNTEWVIDVKPMGGKGKASQDTVTFSDNKVTSKSLSGQGFPASNYSVRLLEDGTVTWETMQTSEKSGIAFWRGDIGPDGIMRGVLSKRDSKNNTSDFNFVSSSSSKIAPAAPIAEVPVAAAKTK